MRQFAIGILCSAAFLATACKPSENETSAGPAADVVNANGEEAGGPYYTIQADEITHANANITAVQGVFRMVTATAATGIPSGGGGGACLVFTAKDLGFTAMDAQKCTTNRDCYHDPEDPTAPLGDEKGYSYVPQGETHRENSYGYCDTKNKQCWSKPVDGNDAVCNRPIKMTVGTDNQVPRNPPAAGPGGSPINVSKWVKQGAKVRIVACLQKTGAKPPPNATGCSSIDGPDRIEVLGEPVPLHK